MKQHINMIVHLNPITENEKILHPHHQFSMLKYLIKKNKSRIKTSCSVELDVINKMNPNHSKLMVQ